MPETADVSAIELSEENGRDVSNQQDKPASRSRQARQKLTEESINEDGRDEPEEDKLISGMDKKSKPLSSAL
jgi:hypothetical protein